MKLRQLPPFHLFASLVGLFILPLSVFAQLTEGTLRGTVADTTGNIVVASPVVAKNNETGQMRSTTTDNNGAFLLAGMAPGSYTVFVRVAGFKTFEQRTIRLSAGQTSEISIKLEIGDLQEVVNIEGGGAQVQIATEGRVSDSLDQRKISELPIPQRDVFALTKLSAGATFIPGDGELDQADQLACRDGQRQSLSWK